MADDLVDAAPLEANQQQDNEESGGPKLGVDRSFLVYDSSAGRFLLLLLHSSSVSLLTWAGASQWLHSTNYNYNQRS